MQATITTFDHTAEGWERALYHSGPNALGLVNYTQR